MQLKSWRIKSSKEKRRMSRSSPGNYQYLEVEFSAKETEEVYPVRQGKRIGHPDTETK